MAETLLLRNADLLCTMQPVGRMTSRAGDDGGRDAPDPVRWVWGGVAGHAGGSRV